MNEISTKIRPALVSLEVGESMEFPIEKMKSVRTQASKLGMILNRQFKTRTNRETHTIMVTRVSYTKPESYECSRILGPNDSIRRVRQ